MSSHLTRKAFDTYFFICDTCHFGPYTINKKTLKIELVKSKFRIKIWYFNNFLLALHIIYYIVFMLVQLFVTPTPYGILLTIINLFMFFICSCIVALNVPFIMSLSDCADILNVYLNVDRRLSRVFKKDLEGQTGRFDIPGYLSNLVVPLLLIASVQNPSIIFLIEEHPFAPLLDFVYPSVTNLFITKCILVVFVFYITLFWALSSSLIAIFLLLCVTSFNKLIELSAYNPKKPRKTELTVKTAIKLYPILYLTNFILNKLIRVFAPPALGCALLVHLFVNYCSIRLFYELGMPFYLSMPLLCIVLLVCEFLILKDFTKSNILAMEFLHSWKGHPSGSHFSRRIIRSFRLIYIEIGDFYGLKRSSFPTFMFILVNYTITLLLSVTV